MRSLSLIVMALVVGCTAPTGGEDMPLPDMTAVFPMGCTSGAQDGDETDVDCGGSCKPCEAGKMCKDGRDCDSTFCTNRACDPPTCKDGVKNGAESDLDCGGACDGCDDGKRCNVGADCKSATCTNGTCAGSPCSNMRKDGDETDVDCGGGTCSACDDGKNCGSGEDCKSGMCTNALCKSPVMCMTGMGDCDGNAANGCESNLNTDAKNCGKCKTVCPVNMPICAAGKCVGGCPNAFQPPKPCDAGKDPQNALCPWVVCRADCMTAWLANATLANCNYHPVAICKSLGYNSVKEFGGQANKVCGYGGADRNVATSCNMPGTEQYDGSGMQPNDQFGMVIGQNVQWLCSM